MKTGGWWKLFVKMGGWWAIGAVVIFLGVTGWSAYDWYLAGRFDRDGVMVPVQVTGLRSERHRTKNGQRTDYYGTLVYEMGGQSFRREESISSAEYRQFGNGLVRDMRVLPDTPDQVETTKGETRKLAITLQIAALIIGGVALSLAYFIGHSAASAVLARRLGHVARTRVTEIKEGKNKGKPTGHGKMTWAGIGANGTSLSHPMADFRDFPVGSEVEVYVRKGRSFWVVDVGDRAAPHHDIPDVARH